VAREPGALERAHGAYEKFAAFCAGLAALAAGAVCAAGAFGVDREIPAHRPIGVGLMVFGAAALLHVLLHARPGRAARAASRRLRSLLLLAIGAGVAVAGVCVMGPKVRAAWVLSRSGVVAPARVVRVVHRRSRTQSFAVATVEYAGRRGEVRVPFGTRAGQTLEVLFAPEEPEVVLPGGEGRGFLDLLDRGPGVGAAALAALLVLVAGLGALVCLKDLMAGPPPA